MGIKSDENRASLQNYQSSCRNIGIEFQTMATLTTPKTSMTEAAAYIAHSALDVLASLGRRSVVSNGMSENG